MSSVGSILKEKNHSRKVIDENDRHFTETELELIAKNDKINKLEDENSILKTAIKDLQDENSMVKTTIKDLQVENSILRMTTEGLHNQIKRLAKQLEHQTAENEVFKSQIQSIAQKIGIGNVNVDINLETNKALKDVDKNENDEPVLSGQDVLLKQKPKKRSQSNDEQNTTSPSIKNVNFAYIAGVHVKALFQACRSSYSIYL